VSQSTEYPAVNGGGDLAAREAALNRREAELNRREAALASANTQLGGVIKVIGRKGARCALCGGGSRGVCVCVWGGGAASRQTMMFFRWGSDLAACEES
jgi:hypothetical protein